jgi:hypothetical protein
MADMLVRLGAGTRCPGSVMSVIWVMEC